MGTDDSCPQDPYFLAQALNRLPKAPGAMRSLGPVRFEPSEDGWWAVSLFQGGREPRQTLQGAVMSLWVTITAIEERNGQTTYWAEPVSSDWPLKHPVYRGGFARPRLVNLQDIPKASVRLQESLARRQYATRKGILEAATWELVEAPGTYSRAFPDSLGWCLTQEAAEAMAVRLNQSDNVCSIVHHI